MKSSFIAFAESSDQDKRLDKFLAEKCPQLSRMRIQDLIKSGHVAQNQRTMTSPSAKVMANSQYRIDVPPAVSTDVIAQNIALDIIYEDADLLVLNKPAGMVTHPGAGNWDKTLVNALLAHCGDSLSGIGGEKRPGIVHRIDKDTSGILVVAKNDAAHIHLSQQFAAHSIKRIYQAFVWGMPNPKTGKVSGQIGRSKSNRKKMAVLKSGGRHAITHYRTMRNFGHNVTLIECQLETGRTHQIRVHMTHIGHPLLGDKTYGRMRSIKGIENALATDLHQFPRQALHAATLGFIHPQTGQLLEFSAPLPDDMQILAEKLSQMS